MSRLDDKLNTYSFGQVEIEGVERRDEIRLNVKHVLIVIGAVTALVVALAVAVGVAYTVYAKKSMPLNPIVSRNFDSNVTVYYAASLNDIMTRVINPEFQTNYNIRVKTVSDASGNLAKFLKAGNVADVFISADSKISASLLPVLLPGKNVPVISWYTLWASTSLGIGYNKQSQFAPIFESIANGSIPWYKGLNPDTMKIGRTDPDLDPKGT